LRPAGVDRKRVAFEGPRGKLVGDIYLPRVIPVLSPDEKTLPAVLVCHGVENNKEVAAAPAIEFARRGFVALAFDYGGYGESADHKDEFDIMVDDTLAALNFLAKLPEVNSEKLAILGHSMGVSYAVATSMNTPFPVRAVVGMGNEALASQIPPRNLMLAMGLYDAFHTLDNMLESVRQSANAPDLEPGQIAGDIHTGNARALFVSPISDHGIEPLDPLLIAESIRWISASMYKKELSIDPVRVRETYRAEARIILIGASGAMLTALLVLWYLSVSTDRRFSIALRTPFLLVAAAAVVGNFASPAVALACADASLALLAAGSVAAHLARSSRRAETNEAALTEASSRLVFGIALLVAVAISLLAGLLIHGVPTALTRAEWAKAIPRFLFHILLLRPYEGWCMMRAYLFSSYSQGWIPELWFGAVILLEAIRPGAIMWAVGRAAQTTVRAFQLRGPFRVRSSGRSWVVLGMAVTGLIVVVVRRSLEGWLTAEALSRMAVIGLKFMVLPLVIFILIVNLPFFRRDIKENAGS